ncbi:MAG: hypothetical protein AB2A00_39220 [Myxococcota bacterium]
MRIRWRSCLAMAWLCACQAAGAADDNGTLTAEFSDVVGANVGTETFSGEETAGESEQDGAGRPATLITATDADGKRQLNLTLVGALQNGARFRLVGEGRPAGNGLGQLFLLSATEGEETPRTWQASAGEVVVRDVADGTLTFEFSDATMLPTSDQGNGATGTFTLRGSGTITNVNGLTVATSTDGGT